MKSLQRKVVVVVIVLVVALAAVSLVAQAAGRARLEAAYRVPETLLKPVAMAY